MSPLVRRILALAAIAMVSSHASAAPPAVKPIRVPERGIQPQVGVDAAGVVHLAYLVGDPQGADIRYARTTAGGVAFGEPVPVNANPRSALATGTVRGPHLAVAADGTAHVAWMGARNAEPKAPGRHAPMLYARLAPGADRFEPERNLVTKFVGLDGGGSVAADDRGNVYVAWHAPATPKGGEASRRVVVARSTDGGATFAPEEPVTDEGLGVCACCGMKLFAPPGGAVVGLFRTAREQVHRDTRAFLFQGASDRRWGGTLDPAESATCMMSTFALADVPGRQSFVAAWETAGRIRFGVYPYRDVAGVEPRDVPGATTHCKHPSVALDADGNLLVAWAEVAGWGKAGSVAWQAFDAKLDPIPGAAGRADGLPAWSRPAACAVTGAGFIVLY